TVSVSPVALSYGVPTGTPVVSPCTVPCSAQETVTVNIIGASTASPVTFGSTTVTGTNYTDFITAGDSCTGQKFTSPATCLVTLYFNASYADSDAYEVGDGDAHTLGHVRRNGSSSHPAERRLWLDQAIRRNKCRDAS